MMLGVAKRKKNKLIWGKFILREEVLVANENCKKAAWSADYGPKKMKDTMQRNSIRMHNDHYYFNLLILRKLNMDIYYFKKKYNSLFDFKFSSPASSYQTTAKKKTKKN